MTLLRRWGATVSRFMGVNALVQAMGLLIGIQIVRGLDKIEYAYYSVFTALLAAFVLLSDSGIAGYLMSQAGPVRNQPARLSVLFRTALHVQRMLAATVGLASAGTLIALLLGMGAVPAVAACLTFAFLLSILPLANKSIFQGYHRVVSNYGSLQRVNLTTATYRLAAVFVLSAASGLSLLGVAGITVSAAFLEAYLMRRKPKSSLDLRGEVDTESRTSQLQTVRRTLPMGLAIVAQTQLLVATLGLLGGAVVLAEISALSRFAAVLAVIAGVVSDIGTGVMARAERCRRQVRNRYAAMLGMFLGLSSATAAVLTFFPAPILAILGNEYAHLETPLAIVAWGTVGIMLADSMRVLNQANGWTKWSWLFIPLTGAWWVAGLLGPTLADVTQAAWWMAAQAIPGILCQLIVFGTGFRDLEE